MKPRTTVAHWMMVLLLLLCQAPLLASQQHSTPIKKKGLIDALGTGGLAPAELIDLIDQRGVNFRLAFDDEEELRNAGASPAVLEAVRKHYRSTAVSPADKTNAANLLKSSRALLDTHDANSALPVANQSLALDPDDAEAYILRGRIYLAAAQPKKAEVDFNIALQIAPGNAEAQRFLATAKNPGSVVAASAAASATGGLDIPAAGHAGFMGFRRELRNGQPVVVGVLPLGSGARAGLMVGDIVLSANGVAFKDFVDQFITPEKVTPGMAVQLQIQRQGQTLQLQLVALPRPKIGDEAIGYFGQVIQQFPGNPEGYLYRAAVFGQLKNYTASLDDWNMFIQLNPNDLVGYVERAKVKTALGDQAGAKADLDVVARLNQPTTATTPNVQASNQANPTAFPERWNLMQLNKNFTLRQVQDHIYFQGIDIQATAEAEKTTDKKGNVVYKGKWRQQNTNGTLSQWNMTLKTVTPERIEGTVLTLGFSGIAVTFIPQN
jgi:tetratricopeptide (TPR) repeat protein